MTLFVKPCINVKFHELIFVFDRTAKPLESFLINVSRYSITSAGTTRSNCVENDKQHW